MVAMTSFGDLLGPPPTLLPGDDDAESALLNHEDPAQVAADHPTASIAWAYLAEAALERGETNTPYANARTGNHRGHDHSGRHSNRSRRASVGYRKKLLTGHAD